LLFLIILPPIKESLTSENFKNQSFQRPGDAKVSILRGLHRVKIRENIFHNYLGFSKKMSIFVKSLLRLK